ncbi:MAG: molybdenum cofactor biosynthesis protein MoaE [Candidatus Sumerlaeia bacterium]|nr:molybdenum cofactor biosynthesis protein MoaE [Candidatus Sumerlaeia bacterium]
MDPQDIILVTRDPIGLDDIVRRLGHDTNGGPGDDDAAGALVTFSGIVRAREGERTIGHLDYEHYDGMAQQEMEKLVALAREKWPLRRVALVHRTGEVAVGEASVIVAVSAGHRKESFAAARYLIDALKESVPIWKQAPK